MLWIALSFIGLLKEMLLWLLKFLLIELSTTAAFTRSQEVRLKVDKVLRLSQHILLILESHSLTILHMLLVKVAALQQYRACTCRCHRQELLLTSATDDTANTSSTMHLQCALSLHVKTIRRFNRIINNLTISSLPLVVCLYLIICVSRFTINSIALRELVKLKKATVVHRCLVPRL